MNRKALLWIPALILVLSASGLLIHKLAQPTPLPMPEEIGGLLADCLAQGKVLVFPSGEATICSDSSVAPMPGIALWERGIDGDLRPASAGLYTGLQVPAPINLLPAQALEGLPGVGQAVAARIVEERSRRPFTNTADLQRVSGIGPKLSQQIGPMLDFAAP